MARRQQRRAPPPFETTQSEDYRYVYATGVFGGVNPNDARLIFYLNRPKPESVPGQPGQMRTARMNQELQVEVHMSPVQYKALSEFMKTSIDAYEKRWGEIELRPETQQSVTDQTPGHVA